MSIHCFSAPKQSISSAVFLIGLATLFALDWFWPGILVLVGLTALLEAGLRRWLPDPDDIPLRVDNPEGAPPPAQRVVPARCPSCGAATPETVQSAQGQTKVVCSYCGSQLLSTADVT
jgi:hypothetical protein